MKKIIVTGGLGFIGSNLIELLINKKYFVINVDKISYSSNTIKEEMEAIQREEENLNKHYKSGILCSLKLKLTYAFMYMIFFLVVNGYSFYLFSNGKINSSSPFGLYI